MKTVYFDCFSGISGDMVIGAMLAAGLPHARLKEELAKLNLSGYEISSKSVNKCGVSAVKFDVMVDVSKQKGHRHYTDIVKMIESSALNADVKKTALSIFRIIGEAEAQVHGVAIEKVHFHEVGAVDSIVDIVGAAIGFAELGIGEVFASAVNTGSGTVMTDHGLLPVPAPATALILRGVPTYSEGPVKELTTPTGAAIIKAMSKSFMAQPLMTVDTVANGAGGYDFDGRPNVLRMFVGEMGAGSTGLIVERLMELSTNIDDMNPQFYAPLLESLFAAGALDVTLTPLQMKKNRPATCVTVLCEPEKMEAMEGIIFKMTTTLGIRRNIVERASLPRRIEKVATAYGEVEVKVATLPDGSTRKTPEYESVKKAAEKSGKTFEEVYKAAVKLLDID
ncbi:MAG: nickel pincer cofactor biosynthesis protein LarC [Nitrospinae bacterium]|nr:nickel pincer cofactor biosynthesis protein LarC [Nitrospinota bacterium]